MRIKTPSRRSLVILSIVLTMFLAFVLPITVSYAQSLDNMIPKNTDPQQQNALYNQPYHYSFQTATPDRHFWEVSAKASDGINTINDHVLSMIFLAGVEVTRFFNFIAREAFHFSFMDSLIDEAEKMVKALSGISGGDLGNGMWNSLFGVLATVTVALVIWQVIRFRFLDSLQTMFSFLLALVVAFAFFANIGTFLRSINGAGNGLASAMYQGLAIPGGLSTSDAAGVDQISNQIWMELVMKPYGMLQFDDAGAYEGQYQQDVINVLKTDPYSDERNKALIGLKDKFPSVVKIRSDEQMVILLCNTLFGAFILGISCFWAIATIFVRIKLLIHAIIMSITLLAALLPGREAGLSVLRSQFLKLIGLVVMTTFTMFFLELSLVMGHLVYNIVAVKAKLGWFTGMLLEAIVIFVIFKYREELGSVFSKAAGHIPMMPKPKSTTVDEIQRSVTRKLTNKAGAAIGHVFNRKEPEGVPSTFKPDSISKASDNLNAATTASMQLRYQQEKEASEQMAQETGQPVQYTPYVQKVNENLRNNTKNPFRGMDKEWKEEKTRLEGIKKDGGDVKQAILTRGVTDDMNDQQVAATMYSNENAIRQASQFMVNRPKTALNQMQRAGTLNKNRKLESSVNDFVMVELFQRYKVEYKQAIDTAAATGEPVQHTDFVKSMDQRFKSAGLTTTQKVNDTMLSRGGRISVASKFETMPEFGQKRDDLLRANEAFRRASAPQEGIAESVPQINPSLPINKKTALQKVGVTKGLNQKGQEDYLIPASKPTPQSHELVKNTPRGMGTKVVPFKQPAAKNDLNSSETVHAVNHLNLLAENKVNAVPKVDMGKVNLPASMKQAMDKRTADLKQTARMEKGDTVKIDTKANIQVFNDMKTKVSQEDSDGMNRLHLHNELNNMQNAKKRGLNKAQNNEATKNIVKNNAQTAKDSRKNNNRPNVK